MTSSKEEVEFAVSRAVAVPEAGDRVLSMIDSAQDAGITPDELKHASSTIAKLLTIGQEQSATNAYTPEEWRLFDPTAESSGSREQESVSETTRDKKATSLEGVLRKIEGRKESYLKDTRRVPSQGIIEEGARSNAIPKAVAAGRSVAPHLRGSSGAASGMSDGSMRMLQTMVL